MRDRQDRSHDVYPSLLSLPPECLTPPSNSQLEPEGVSDRALSWLTLLGLHSLAQASWDVLPAELQLWMLLFWLPRLQCCGHSLGQPCWSPAARRGQSRQVLGMLSLTHFGFARSAAQAFGSGLALHVTQVAAVVVDVGPLEYSPEGGALRRGCYGPYQRVLPPLGPTLGEMRSAAMPRTEDEMLTVIGVGHR